MSKAETIRSGRLGSKDLRLVRKGTRFYGLVDGIICVEGDVADEVWRLLHDDAGKSDPRYLGFDGARARFLRFFPGGFQSEGYAMRERKYKDDAKEMLDRRAPLEKALDGSGYGEAALAVFRATNMLSPFEKTRLQDVLRGARADDFMRAAARFTLERGKANLVAMEQVLRPHDNVKWTVVTYLPYLWRPDIHMFLKPEATKDFAIRVGHRFASDYEARLDMAVYDSLLDLVDKTAAKLGDMAPRDRIDIQSFIWVVGNYTDENYSPSNPQ